MKTNALAVVSARSLAFALLVGLAGLPAGAAVFDDFESYAVGSNLHGQGGWSGWAGDPGAGALVSTAFSFSPTRAVNVTGASDLVHSFSGVTNGQWVFKVMQYIPSTSSGTNYVILLNRYGPPFGVTDLNWSVQFQNNLNTGQIISDLGGGASRPMVKNQWVEIRVEVNLASNTVAEYYNGQLLSTHVWQDGTGLNELQALDLFADDSGPVYYDNLSLAPAGTLLQLRVTVPSSFNEFTPQAVLEWNGEPGKTYVIQSTDDLAATNGWQDVDVVTCKSSDPCRWDGGPCRQAKFYRLVLPQPAIFDVQPAFIDSNDTNATLYILGQMLPTSATVIINGLSFAATNDGSGALRVLSLNGLPPGEPVLGTLTVIDNGTSNVVATLPVQSPILYGPELTTEQLQGPPEEPPASPSKKEFKGHVTLLKAFDDDDDDDGAASARGHTKSGHVTLLKRGGDDGSAARGHTKSGHVTLLKRGEDDGFDGAKKEFKGHVTLLKRGGADGDGFAISGSEKHTKSGHVTLLKREAAPPGGDDCDDLDTFAATGELHCRQTDLVVPGVGLDFVWTRTYRSRTGPTTAQGPGWDFSYNVSLAPQPNGTMILYPGNGRADTFYPSGTNLWTRDEYFVEIGDLNGDGMPDVLFADTGRWLFKPLGTPAGGKLWQVIDCSGSTITLDYNLKGQLTTIVDDLDRTNTVAYTLSGQIESVTDFSGRTVRYEYDGNGDLVACVSPPVTGTPTGNDFPGGITNRYTYSSGNPDDRLNHNLTSCIDGNGLTWVQIIYQPTNNPASIDFDAVATMLRGVDKKDIRRGMVIAKPSSRFASVQAIMNDYVGNVTEFLFDSRQRCISQREFTGRANPLLPTTTTENRPVGKLRVDDPDFYETTWTWNPDSLCVTETRPGGDSTECVYQRAFNQNSSRSNNAKAALHMGDLRVLRERACCGGADLDGDGVSDTTELAWHFDYDPRFGSPTLSARGKKLYVGNLPFSARGPRQTTSLDGSFDGDNTPIIKGSALGGNSRGKSVESAKVIVDRDSGRSKGFGFVTSATDPRGIVTMANYDTNGNLTHLETTERKNGYVVAADFNYKERARLAAITNAPDANGYRRVDTFDYYTNGPQAGYLQSYTRDLLGHELTHVVQQSPRGRITSITDPLGNDWLFTYNALDQCVRSQTPTNIVARITTDCIYDANGNEVENVIEYRDADDGATHLVHQFQSYDALDRCTAVAEQVSPGVFVTNRFFYDGNSQLILAESPMAVSGADPHNAVAYEYDERRMLFREIGAPGSGSSPTNQYDYDANGACKGVAKVEALVFKLASADYDGLHRLIGVTDAMGNMVSYVYDRNGNCTRVRYFGETNDVPGNAGNRLLAETRYTYDSFDRCVQQVDSFFDLATMTAIGDGQVTTTFAYAPNGDCTSVTDDNGHTTRFAFDTAGRLASIMDPKTNVVSYSYDQCDNIIGVTQTDRSDLTGTSQQFTVIRAFNKLHRLTRTVDNVGNTNSYDYDSLGRLARQTDPKGSVSWFVYDDLDRLARSISDMNGDGIPDLAADADNSWSYDDNSRCIAATDDNTNTTYYAYNWMDCVVSITSPDGTGCGLVWSPRSNLIQETDANGSVITNTYDRNDRLIHRDVAARVAAGVATTTTFETFAYDGLSQLVAATNDASGSTFAYDSLGNRVRNVSGGVGALVRTYDGEGNRLSVTYPSGRLVTYTYDALDQVASVSSGSGGLPPALMATCEYEGPGRVGRVSRANNVNTRIQWDGTVNPPNATDDFGWGQVRAVNHQIAGGGTTIDRRVYAFDRNQNKILRAQASPFVQNQPTSTNTWSYDPLDRMAQSTLFRANSLASKSYVLDGNGNRQLVLSNGIAEPYIMDSTPFPGPADFQMNQYTITPFGMQTYDNNGNLIGRNSMAGQLQYQYDYANRLVAVYDLSGGFPAPLAVFAYDALGRRIGKTVYPPAPLLPVTTGFVYDDEDIIEEHENGVLQFFAVWPHMHQTASHMRISAAGTVLYAQADDLGNVLALTDAAGLTVERYDYDDFGFPHFLTSDGFPMATNSSPAGNPFLFQCMEWEPETGLYVWKEFSPAEEQLKNNPRHRTAYFDPQTGRPVSYAKLDGGMPNRISMNVTTPKQTQGATFGEKVNQGLHAAGSALAQGRSVGFGGGGGGGGGGAAGILFNPREYTLTKSYSRPPRSREDVYVWKLKKEEGGRHTPFHNRMLGGALPGGAVISAAVSSVSAIGGGGGGAGGWGLAKPRDPWKTYWERHYHKTGHVTLMK